MSKNVGKIFEESFQKSVPEYTLLHRLPDSAQSFGGGNNLRFSKKNPFDFILWDSKEHILYALELKTTQGKSISFERNKNENGAIHYHQVVGLNHWSEYDGIISGFIIEFREIETTIFVDIKDFNKISETVDKKSFTIKDLDSNSIPYFVIPQEKRRTRYRYDVAGFLERNKRGILYGQEKHNSK